MLKRCGASGNSALSIFVKKSLSVLDCLPKNCNELKLM